MFFSKKQKIFFALALCCLYGIAWFAQTQLFFQPDVLWQLQLAHRVLRGGNYITDFFETTPPLGFIVLMPVMGIKKLLSLSPMISCISYIFLCASFSLWLCYCSIKKLFSSTENMLAMIVLLSIAVAYLIISAPVFGEREHFFVLFTFPYFLLSACRLHHQKINIVFALTVGLLGAIGFSIKPFFLAAFILTECYVAWSLHREKKYRTHPETVCVLAFLPLYLLTIYLFFKPYLFKIIPITLRFYYPSFNSAWGNMAISAPIFICYVALLFYALTYKKNPHQKLSTIMAWALIGNLFAFFIQRINWFYHLLPAFSVAWVLSVFLWVDYLKNHRDKLMIGAVGLFLFFPPLYSIIELYAISADNQRAANPLICFLHKTAQHHGIYFLSAHTAYLLSAAYDARIQSPAHFEFLLWMRDYDNALFLKNRTPLMKKDADYLAGLVAEDLNDHQPNLVFVDVGYATIENEQRRYIHYLHFLMQNRAFQKAWRQYHYVLSIRKKNQYHFDLYARRTNSSAVFPITSPSCSVFSACNAAFHTTAFCSHNKITVEPKRK